MGRSPCCAKEGLNRGAWTATEDKILTSYIKVHGEGKWRNLPKKAGLKRCGKSCRLRWLNYLKPDIKRGNITIDEEELIVRLHKLLGNRWSLIAGRLPGRTDNEIKNYWNTKIEKKLKNKENHQNANPSHEAPKNCHDQHQDKAGPIRTKASRCRKVSIPAELLSNGTIGPEKQQSDFNTKSILASKFPSSSVVEKSSPALEADISSDFLLDFEINEQFLTDILKMDFSEQVDFANGASLSSDDNNNTCDQGLLSPDSSKTLLASDELLHDNLEFPPTMTSIEDQAGLEFEWIQENQD